MALNTNVVSGQMLYRTLVGISVGNTVGLFFKDFFLEFLCSSIYIFKLILGAWKLFHAEHAGTRLQFTQSSNVLTAKCCSGCSKCVMHASEKQLSGVCSAETCFLSIVSGTEGLANRWQTLRPKF